MTAFFARHFTQAENEVLDGIKVLPEPVYGDEKDFTGVWKMSSNSDESEEEHKYSYADQIGYYTEKVMDYTLFSMFPYVLLSIIFFSVIRLDGTSFADLIDCGFLL